MTGRRGRITRAAAGPAALVAALLVVLCALVTGGRAWLATSATTAFTQVLQDAPRAATSVGLRYSGELTPQSVSPAYGRHLNRSLRPPLSDLVGRPWPTAWSPQVHASLPSADGLNRELTVVGLPPGRVNVQWVAGHAPRPGAHRRALPDAVSHAVGHRVATVIQVGVSRPSARALKVHPGSYTTALQTAFGYDNPASGVVLEVTGVYRPGPRSAALDATVGGLRRPEITHHGTVIQASVLAADTATVVGQRWLTGTTVEWTFPGGGSPSAQQAKPLAQQVTHLSAGGATRLAPAAGRHAAIVTGLGALATRFLHDQSVSNAAITLPIAAVLACALLVLALAGTLLARRRRDASALLAARGAGPWQLLRLRGGEALLLAVPAVLIALGSAAAIRGGAPTGPDAATAVIVGAVGAALVTTIGMVPVRAGRTGPSRRRQAVWAAVQALAVVLAVVGVGILAGRGRVQAGDPFLTLVPILVALGATLVATRGLPHLLGWMRGVAARGRHLASLITTSEALHAARVSVLPALVMVLAGSVAVLSLAVTGTVARGVQRSAWEQVGADVMVRAGGLGSRVQHRVAALPGVQQVAVARVKRVPVEHAAGLDEVTLVAVDPKPLERVRRGAPDHADVNSIAGAHPARGRQVPAVASPNVRPAGGPVTLATNNGDVRLRVTGHAHLVPGLPGDSTFVLVSRRALARVTSAQPRPNVLLIRGSPAASALRNALGATAATATITRRRQVVRRLEAVPMTARTTTAFWACTAVAGLLALAGVVLAGSSGAARRRRTATVLDTLGAGVRRTCWAAPAQLAPVVLLAPTVGALVGYGLGRLLGPALHLAAFAGNPAVLNLSPDATQAGLVAAGTVVLAVVALTTVTLAALRRPEIRAGRLAILEEP